MECMMCWEENARVSCSGFCFPPSLPPPIFSPRLCTSAITLPTPPSPRNGAFQIIGDAGPPLPPRPTLPTEPPDAAALVTVSPQQALLYRLSGDYNAIHADPEAARAAGLEKPVLHGLCSLGAVGRVESYLNPRGGRGRGALLVVSTAVLQGLLLCCFLSNHYAGAGFNGCLPRRKLVVVGCLGEARLEGKRRGLGSLFFFCSRKARDVVLF